jgi:hypothetical protein
MCKVRSAIGLLMRKVVPRMITREVELSNKIPFDTIASVLLQAGLTSVVQG